MDTKELGRHTFARINDDGIIEIVDEITGEVVAYQRTLKDIYQMKEETFVPIEYEGREVWVERGVNLDSLPATGSIRPEFKYSTVIVDIICSRIAEGESLTKICKDPALPTFATISRWRRANDEFDQAIRHAYEDRAHYYHDKAIETAESTADKEEAAINRLKIDTYKWTAERSNRKQFATKDDKKEVQQAATVTYILTGVPQPADMKDVTPEPQAIKGDQVIVSTDTEVSNDKSTDIGSGESSKD